MKPAVFLYGVPGQYGNYAAALEAAGARVVLCRDLYRSLDCDGLLLPGGGDIRGPLPGTETFLVDSFVRSRRPILGICRGMQALNVYWGGTLRRSCWGSTLPLPAATIRRWTAWQSPCGRCNGRRTA